MVDYNQSLTPGDVDGGFVNVVVEIPARGCIVGRVGRIGIRLIQVITARTLLRN